MLLFSSGTFTVDGITVFPDHADPNQFWYLPGPVGLETQSAESKEPQFLLIMYAPDVAAAGIKGTGFLAVTLALKVPDDTLGKIIGKIRTQSPDVSDPRLAPVPFDEGTVQIVTLDMQGNDITQTDGQSGQKILGASSPELFGNNDALFGLVLGEEDATILQAAFIDGMAPVGGIYNLKFTGVLPALDIKITADLKRMYTSFGIAFGASAYWASAGIDATFEKLRQDGVIKVEVVNLSLTGDTATQEQWALGLFKDQIMSQWFTPSLSPTTQAAADASSVSVGKGGGTAPAGGGTAQGGGTRPSGSGGMTPPATGAGHGSGGVTAPATNSGSGMSAPVKGGTAVKGGTTPPPAAGGAGGATPPTTTAAPTATPAPTTAPPAATPAPTAAPPATAPPTGGGSGDGAAKAVAAVAGTAAAASAAASPFGLSLRLKYVSQDELKTVEIEFNQMNAVQRVYSPQGYFGLLLKDIDQSKHFLKVDGTDPFFNHFAVTVNPPKDFTGIGLSSAHVALDYGDATKGNTKHGEFLFDPAHQTQQVWEVFEGLIQQTSYSYTPDYKFDPESGWYGEQTTYALATQRTDNRVLNLDPYELLGFLQVTITPDRMNADLVDRVEVALQYTAKSGWQQASTILVRPGNAPQTWKVRRAEREDTSHLYSYSTTCYLKDGTMIAGATVSTSATAILVSDPFVAALDVMVQPAFDGNAFKMAIVEIMYTDDAASYNFETIIQLQASSPASKIHIPLIHRATNQFQYRISLITTAQQKVQGSYVMAQDPLVLVTGAP